MMLEIWITEYVVSGCAKISDTTRGISGGSEVKEKAIVGEESNESRGQGIRKIIRLDVKSSSIYERSFWAGV